MLSRSHTSLGRRFAVLACFGTITCGGPSSKPLPPERAAYAGKWHSADVALTISEQGQVIYDRREGTGNVHVEGSIAGWSESGFVVGVMTVKTDFKVTRAPAQIDGVWQMTVNGDDLIRTDP